MTGIILAGGENRRMATNKAFLKVNGKPIIERILMAFEGLFEEIIIVTNTPELYISYDVILVGDIIKNKGPIAGIYSGLLNAKNIYSFVVACDMPFLNRSLISYMMGLSEGNDMVIPKINGLVEPLHAVYSKSCLPLIEICLKEENISLRDLIGRCKVRYVEKDEITAIDLGREPFISINTPEDLKKITEKTSYRMFDYTDYRRKLHQI